MQVRVYQIGKMFPFYKMFLKGLERIKPKRIIFTLSWTRVPWKQSFIAENPAQPGYGEKKYTLEYFVKMIHPGHAVIGSLEIHQKYYSNFFSHYRYYKKVWNYSYITITLVRYIASRCLILIAKGLKNFNLLVPLIKVTQVEIFAMNHIFNMCRHFRYLKYYKPSGIYWINSLIFCLCYFLESSNIARNPTSSLDTG